MAIHERCGSGRTLLSKLIDGRVGHVVGNFSCVRGPAICQYLRWGRLAETVSEFYAAGNYVMSVYAAAPDGSVTIPGVGTLALNDGDFVFRLNNTSIGGTHTVPAGSSWNLYSVAFAISTPGSYDLGILNSPNGPYFINYDAFSIQQVPETSAVAMIGLGCCAIALAERRRRCDRVRSHLSAAPV